MNISRVSLVNKIIQKFDFLFFVIVNKKIKQLLKYKNINLYFIKTKITKKELLNKLYDKNKSILQLYICKSKKLNKFFPYICKKVESTTLYIFLKLYYLIIDTDKKNTKMIINIGFI